MRPEAGMGVVIRCKTPRKTLLNELRDARWLPWEMGNRGHMKGRPVAHDVAKRCVMIEKQGHHV